MPKNYSPTAYASRPASQKHSGNTRFATQAEAEALTAKNLMISPLTLSQAIDDVVPDATTAVEGKVLLATDAIAQAKSVSTNTSIIPANLAASGFVQWADVTITATEIKALTTAQKELVAAPAAGSAHLFLGAVFKLNYGSEVFTESGDNLAIKYTDDSGVAVSQTIETTGWIDQSADTQTNAIPALNAIVASSGAEAQALVLDNLGSDIAGNASNDSTVTVRIYYVTQAL